MFRMTSDVFDVDNQEASLDRPYHLLDKDYTEEFPRLREHDHYDPSLMGRLFSWQSSLVDRAALKVMEKVFLSGDGTHEFSDASHRLDDLHDRYANPGLIGDPERFFRPPDQPPHIDVQKLESLEDGRRLEVAFRSTYQVFERDYAFDYRDHAPNDICRARVWQHDGGDDRPTMVCLHCWCGGRLWMEERIFGARKLYESGYDVVLVSLPFHGHRTPSSAVFSGQFFPSPDLQRTNEAFGEAVADIRVLVEWIRSEGNQGALGVTGISLGGYTSALLVSLFSDFDFAIPMIAPASFSDILWWHGRGRSAHEDAARKGVTLEALRRVWALHSPLSHELRIPRENVKIVAAPGDAVVRPAQTLALWEHWNRPEIDWISGSHMSYFTRRSYVDRMIGWLDERGFAPSPA